MTLIPLTPADPEPRRQADTLPLARLFGLSIATLLVTGALMNVLSAGESDPHLQDRLAVSRLDIEYQAAVKRNDAQTMARILHDDFVLVTGRGHVHDKRALIDETRARTHPYDLQDEVEGTQTVRFWGDTAVVTALLRIKDTTREQPIDVELWFSDTYVRTPDGWKYAFGQSSLPLPKP